MTIEFTQEQIKQLEQEVIRLATVYPDAEYCADIDNDEFPDCLYSSGVVWNGPPEEGCIMGQAMRNLGIVDPEEIDNGDVTLSIRQLLGERATESQREFLGLVQLYQDQGYPWRNAVKSALGQE